MHMRSCNYLSWHFEKLSGRFLELIFLFSQSLKQIISKVTQKFLVVFVNFCFVQTRFVKSHWSRKINLIEEEIVCFMLMLVGVFALNVAARLPLTHGPFHCICILCLFFYNEQNCFTSIFQCFLFDCLAIALCFYVSIVLL